MVLFDAAVAAVEQMDDVNAFVVILAEKEDGTGNRLEIQRALELDVTDEELGMGTYCLCVSSGATHYGGVTSWSVDSEYLVLALDPDAAEALGVPVEFSVALHLSAEALLRLRTGLQRTLDGIGA
jgi:Immunity protein 10